MSGIVADPRRSLSEGPAWAAYGQPLLWWGIGIMAASMAVLALVWWLTRVRPVRPDVLDREIVRNEALAALGRLRALDPRGIAQAVSSVVSDALSIMEGQVIDASHLPELEARAATSPRWRRAAHLLRDAQELGYAPDTESRSTGRDAESRELLDRAEAVIRSW